MIGVYKITNTANGKIYVGSSVCMEKRWNQHRKRLNLGRHHSCTLQKDWKHYGADAFWFTVVEVVEDRKLVRARESYWIHKLNSVRSGYSRTYEADVKTDNALRIRNIKIDSRGNILPKSLIRKDRRLFNRLGQEALIESLKESGREPVFHLAKLKKKKKQYARKSKKAKIGGCLVWANTQPHIIRS